MTPGWLRSEMMLDNYGVTEGDWRDGDGPDRADGGPVAPAGVRRIGDARGSSAAVSPRSPRTRTGRAGTSAR